MSRVEALEQVETILDNAARFARAAERDFSELGILGLDRLRDALSGLNDAGARLHQQIEREKAVERAARQPDPKPPETGVDW